MAENDAFRNWLLMFVIVITKVIVLSLRVWKAFLTWFLNLVLSFLLVWPFNLLGVTMAVEDFGFLRVQGLYIGWKNNKNMSLDVGELKVRVNWSLRNWRNLSIKVYVKNLRADIPKVLRMKLENGSSIQSSLSGVLVWKMYSTSSPAVVQNVNSSPCDSVQLVPEFNILNTTFFWLQATDVAMETKILTASEDEMSFAIKSKRFDVVLVPLEKNFVLMATAGKININCGIDMYQTSGVDRDEKVIDLEKGEVLACWSCHGPNCFSFGCRSFQVQVVPEIVESVLKMVDQVLRPQSEESCLENDALAVEPQRDGEWEEERVEPMIFRLFVVAEEIGLSVQDEYHRELLCVKACLNYLSDNWRTKIKNSATFGLSAALNNVQEDSQDGQCLLIGDKETENLWTCKLSCLIRPAQSTVLSLTAESYLSLVLKPECVEGLSAAYTELSHLIGFTEKKLSSHRELVTVENLVQRKRRKTSSNKQIAVEFKGFEANLQLHEDEQVMAGVIENVKLVVNKDTECTECEFSIVDFKVKDCVTGGMAVTKQPSNDQKYEPIVQFDVKILASKGKDKVSFQRMFGKLCDLSVVLEEQFMFKLLQFGGVDERSHLWGSAEQAISRNEPAADSMSVYNSSTGSKTHCYFERFQLEPVELVLSLHRADDHLPDELQELKERLEIPQFMPPHLEKAKVKFVSFLRTGIYYRSPESVLKDLKRHYLKEVGLQSAKILGSLHLLGNVTELRTELAEGLSDLRETGDYAGFMQHLGKGLSKSYQKFTDSWSLAITGSPNRRASTGSPNRQIVDEPVVSEVIGEQQFATPDATAFAGAFRGVFGTLTGGIGGLIFSPQPSDPQEYPTKQVEPVESRQEESDDSRKQKGQEFLRRLKLDLDELLEDEQFLCCLKLRYESPPDRLNAVVSSHKVYLMKVGPPLAQHVVLHRSYQSLLKAQHKFENDQHYLELVTRLSGTRKLAIASRDPSDNPLVRCDSMSVACRASEKINEAIKKFDELQDS